MTAPGQPAPSPPARQQLARLAGCEPLDLAETACLLGRLERSGDETAWLGALDRLAMDVRGGEADALARAGHLSAVLAGRHGFAAADFDEPGHASLPGLLETGEGSAEALGILWLETARRAGWPAEALAFPAAFIVRLGGKGGGRVMVDPVSGGMPVEPHDLRALLKAHFGLTAELEPAHFAALDNRAILVRLQNEEKVRHLRRSRVAEALTLVESILLFAPDRTELWREAGMMHLRLDRVTAAIAALEQYVARAGNCPQRRRTQMLLQDLKARQQ